MSDYLPEPIIENILLSLPAKSLMKCTIVYKSWMSLINYSTFINTHLGRAIQDDDARLFLLKPFSTDRKMSNKSYSLKSNDPVSGECKLIAYNNGNIVYKGRNVSARNLIVVGTCNGLVCLAHGSNYDDSPIIIWNPSIRKIVISPTPAD